MKRLTAILLVCGVLCVSLTGCGRASDRIGQESVSTATESDENAQDLGEDYVYDYQVSMEPIPKEIAELGGPCQGTIHAFPSKIKMGLTQKMMEEDPELKAEVEKRIPEIEQALMENIGGEFKIDGVVALSELNWAWYCTEVSTGHQFSIVYINNEYDDQKNGWDSSLRNLIFFEGYYEAEKTANMTPEIEPFILDVFEGYFYKIWIQGSADNIDIYIMQFTDEEVDKSSEQVKILQLWEKLQEYDSDRKYNLFLIYFPATYQEVIKQKYEEGCLTDMRLGGKKELIQTLLQAGEIKDFFVYDAFWNEDINTSLNDLLEQYKVGKNFQNQIWEYWLSEK